MQSDGKRSCGCSDGRDCQSASRRDFLKVAGLGTVALCRGDARRGRSVRGLPISHKCVPPTKS